MWELTESAQWVGWMTGSRNLPLLVLALPAGVMADRFDRSKVITVTQSAMGLVAVAMAVLTIGGWMTAPLLLILGLCLGVGVALNQPAWHTLVPSLVPRAMVTSAVALNSVAFNVARSFGPALAGAVVAAFGAGVAFGINSVSYLGVIVVVVLIGKRLASSESDPSSAVNAMRLGLRYARHTQQFRRLLVLGALFAISSAVLQAMLPVRAEELGGGAGLYGVLLGMMGVGAAVGGTLVTTANRWMGERAIPLTIILYGLAAFIAGSAPTVLLTAIPMVLAGMFWVWTLSTINGTVQVMAPDWVRGRAIALWLLSYAGMVPLGAIIAGTIAERVGAGGSLQILSLFAVVVGLGALTRGVQNPSTVETPEFTPRPIHDHRSLGGSPGPVLIVSTWTVANEDVDEFVALLQDIRTVRLQTGGYRWEMYRDVDRVNRFTESYLVPTWDDHVIQHRRIDDASVSLFRRARDLDNSDGGPVSRHLLAFDVHRHDPDWAARVRAHEELHATDGSIPRLRWGRSRESDDDDADELVSRIDGDADPINPGG